MGYQYTLYQHRKKLREERDMLFQDNNSMSKEEYWDDYSEELEYSRERRRDPKHNRGTTARSRKERCSRSLTPQLEKEEEDFVQEIPEAALIAAHTYLLTTRPEPGDPREDMHQAAIRSLRIVENKIRGKGPEMKSTSYKEKQKEKYKYNSTQNEYSESSEEERRQKRKGDASRSWLNTLPNESIGSWGELESQFARNFRSTYKRPASLEEVKACVQRKGETLCSYIQRWSVIKNSAADVSDERAIDAFSAILRRSDLAEEIGRTRPTTVAELMEEANKFADGENAYNNKRGRSPEIDRTSRQRRRHCSRDNQRRRN
jgi:hypothetical protein